MQKRTVQTALLLLMGLVTFQSLQAENARFPLTASQVADLITSSGVSAGPKDVELPLALFTSAPSPHLTITGADPAGDAHLRLRISCAVQRECLPFFAVVDLHDKKQALAAQSLLSSTVSTSPAAKAVNAPILQAGQHAVLLLGDQHMQITLPVVTIDTGRIGTEIRVASLDRKQTYRAIVVQPGVVRGELP